MTTSGRFGTFTDQPQLKDAELSRVKTIGGLLLLVLALMLLGGCCNHQVLEALAEDSIAANAGHAADDQLPVEARMIGEVNHDAWQQVRFIVTGQEVDADVAARRDARAGE